MFKECLDSVRKTCPLIHNITNYVTVNDVANAILASGASPIMADEEAEVEEITSICAGLNINIGTLNARTILSMKKAGKKANELCHKVLLDPVGAGASTLRTNTALNLINEIKFDVIRGNISEIKTLSRFFNNNNSEANSGGSTKGVDADIADRVTNKNLLQSVEFIKNFSKATSAIIAVTGKIDLVSDGERCFVIRNGMQQMGKVTGTGCMLSGIMTAFIAANSSCVLEASAASVCMMGLAGQIAFSAMKRGEGNATYRNRIIDALYNMNGKNLEKGALYEIL